MTYIVITTIAIALLSFVASNVTAFIRRRVTGDIKLVFKTGQRVIVSITPGMLDYQIGQKIGDAVDEILFAHRRSGAASLSAKEAFAFVSPVLPQPKILGIEKIHGVEKFLVAPASHVTIGAEHFGKAVTSKHVEMRTHR